MPLTSELKGEAKDRLIRQVQDAFGGHLLGGDAEAVLAFIADKPMPGHKVRIRPAPAGILADAPAEAPADAADTGQTIIEILNDDMPFLVDSVLGELQARGLVVRQIRHPILKTRRDPAGRLQAVLGPGDRAWSDSRQESNIVILLGDALSDAAATELARALSSILDEVRLAVADWQPMLELVQAAAHRLRETPPPKLPPAELSEAVAFLQWLAAGHFTLLGAREYRVADAGPKTGELVPIAASGLGVLRDPAVHPLNRGSGGGEPQARRRGGAQPLAIGRASLMSRIHRRVGMHYVSIKSYRPDGALSGEILIVGLFTSQAYTRSARDIPLLRHKVETVLRDSAYPPGSHDAKALVNVLETFPRDELITIGTDRLRQWSEDILDLELRPRVRVLARIDRHDRFVTVLIYVPRDRYNSSVRERIGALLEAAYRGRVTAFYPYFTDAPLVRVHFVLSREGGDAPQVDTALLEERIADLVRTWDDRLNAAIAARGAEAPALLARYGTAFPADYAATFPAERALQDIGRIERLDEAHMPVAIDFYREDGEQGARLHAAVYRFGGPLSLSERVPLLENLGFRAIDERSYQLDPRLADGVRPVTLHDMLLERADGIPVDLATHERRLEAAFRAVFHGEADNDNFNRLIISAGADWHSVAVLRALAAYLRQLGVPFGPRYIADTLNRHAGVTRDLLELFHLRFDPDRPLGAGERKAAEQPIRARIEGALAAVPSLDEDRILRMVLNLIDAMVRTNFYQTGPGGRLPETLAFKFDSKAVEAAPQPRPFREIWVYAPRLEGIHLRFAPIARGGIRWSDRAQDFRTEVLGLVRAQLVKNAVIVPSGAKGGFLPKQLPLGGTRDEVQREAIGAYRVFISALLDLTDNIVNGRIVPPPRVVRYDGDDAYLVVAADKGTATFSDIANEIAREHGFWLGDAFASGGSAGYDHKGMGITARGAWECVKRHFREMDTDIQKQPFRVVGVGDMSGDVFGNGMLLSEQARLVAAFDHRDIFIDPAPDAAKAFAERKRLFALPRSSWQDYDPVLISRGGGVFPRAAKSIALSPEMKALLGLDVAALTPNELIRAILKCEVDLIWLGGIGTYVRASTERDADVGDRANDALRITAAQVRAKVIGEGANLGVTQRGRIEFADAGGRVNTDFIDNSAGVNTSDQEVNIKIALAPAVQAGALDDTGRRQLLAEMTADVAAASLRNNYQQSLALSLAERRSVHDLPDYALLMHDLEARGLLDRGLEALPADMELAERARTAKGLTRPELAVLLSYAKIALQHDLLGSEVPDDVQMQSWLAGYFPPLLRERFPAGIDAHSLRREIVALGLTNMVVNRAGPTLVVRLAAEIGAPTETVARAAMAAREVLDLPRLWARIDALDGKIGGEPQLTLYEATRQLLIDNTRRLLASGAARSDLAAAASRHKAAVAVLADGLDGALPPPVKEGLRQAARRLADNGVPADLAEDIARLDVVAHAPAIADIVDGTGTDVLAAARIYLEIGQRLHIDELAARGAAIATTDRYDRMAIARALDRLAAARASFTREAIHAGGSEAWTAAQGERLARAERTLAEAAGPGALTLSRLAVAAATLGDLAAGRL